MDGNLKTQSKCLICATQICTFPENECSEKSIVKHLKIVFLLRNVLNISSDKLVKFLEDCPNIQEWISVCDTCVKLVNQCEELYHDLLKVTRKFEKGRETVIKTLKESCFSSCYKDENYDEGILDIYKDVRKDVNERKCKITYKQNIKLKGVVK